MWILYVSGSHNRNIFHAATLSLIWLVAVVSTPINYILHYAWASPMVLPMSTTLSHIKYVSGFRIRIGWEAALLGTEASSEGVRGASSTGPGAFTPWTPGIPQSVSVLFWSGRPWALHTRRHDMSRSEGSEELVHMSDLSWTSLSSFHFSFSPLLPHPFKQYFILCPNSCQNPTKHLTW